MVTKNSAYAASPYASDTIAFIRFLLFLTPKGRCFSVDAGPLGPGISANGPVPVLEHLCNALCSARRTARLDRSITHRRAQSGERSRSQVLRFERGVVDARVGAVVGEAPSDVLLLLEVPAQREAQEGPPRRYELHARAEPALNHGQVTAGEVLEEVMHVGAHFEPWEREGRA